MGEPVFCIELFSGIGGFGYGIREALKEAGRDGGVVWANDIDPYACAIYRYQFGRDRDGSAPDGIEDEGERGKRSRDSSGRCGEQHNGSPDRLDDTDSQEKERSLIKTTIYEGDIRAVDPADIPPAEIITFGWPCQDNSVAGKRAGQKADTRSGLLFEAVRIIRAKKPKYFIAENVPGLFSVSNGHDFYEAIRLFADAGYDCEWQVLDSRWFLDQNRKRIYFVGYPIGCKGRRPKVFPIGEATEDDNGQVQASE